LWFRAFVASIGFATMGKTVKRDFHKSNLIGPQTGPQAKKAFCFVAPGSLV
jgi:hypothetical protein